MPDSLPELHRFKSPDGLITWYVTEHRNAEGVLQFQRIGEFRLGRERIGDNAGLALLEKYGKQPS